MEGNEKFNCYKVETLPTVIYVPDFITEREENLLLNNIYRAPKSTWKSLKNRKLQNWGGIVHEKGLLPQALPSWLTNVTQKIYEEYGLFPSAINHVLINEYLPNQGIMPHQDGPAYFPVVAILSLGSPVVMEFTPHSRLRSCPDDANSEHTGGGDSGVETDKWVGDHCPFSVLLMPRSLLIFKDKAYSDYLHGIQDTEVHQYTGAVNNTEALKHELILGSREAIATEGIGDQGTIRRTHTRVSLTCRLVPKVQRSFFRI